MRRASLFFSPKAVVVSTRCVAPLYQVQRAAFSFKSVTRTCPRVFYNTRFMSWQWLLAGVAIPSMVWAYYSYITNYQGVPFATSSNELQFSQAQVTAAATWWAQFLTPNTNFSEINKNTSIKDGIFESVVQMRLDLNDRITDEQIKKFIEILSAKIQLQKLQTGLDLPYVQLGHRSSYQPPKIVEESPDEANISGVFPFKTEMRIYSNGPVVVNDKCIYTDPLSVHYDSKTSFAGSTEMIISGDKFREITIPLSVQQGLWEGWEGHWQRIDPKRLSLRSLGSSRDNVDSNIYAKVHLHHFKGSETDFLTLTNEDWIRILSTWSELEKYMDVAKLSIFYDKHKISPQEKNSFGHIGPVTYQLVDQNRQDYYEHTTGRVRVLSAPRRGTVGNYYLRSVSAGDMILKRECEPEKGAVFFLPASETLFSARPLSQAEKEKDLSSQEKVNLHAYYRFTSF